ncbi:MAG TPA: MFS transporter [Mucilaginibacter sp.]|nr:MFS transporter [Mucilaginibacter sp.]
MLSRYFQLYKQAYHGLSKNSWYLSLVMLINRSGTMVVPYLSIYCIQKLHFSIIQAGIIMAVFGVGSIAGAFIGGKLTDKFGFYDLQVGALFTGGVFFLILGYQTTFWGLLIGTFILSICNESFRPANSTAIAHYATSDNKIRSYSLNRLAVNLGWAVGGGLGGFLASYSYHLLFWVDGCTNILAALILIKLMPRAGVVKQVKDIAESIKGSSPYKDRVYLCFIVLAALFGACFFQFFIMQPVFYKIEWHFSERFIGFLLALNGVLIAVIEMVLIHNLEGKRNPLTYICMGILLTGASFVLLNFLPGTAFVAIVIVIMVTFGEMLSMPFMNAFWIVRTSPNNRGQYAALYTMSWSAAQIIAPSVGSEVIHYGGFRLLWWVLGGVCLLSAIGYRLLYKVTYHKKTIAV